jgi:hypothetical protein
VDRIGKDSRVPAVSLNQSVLPIRVLWLFRHESNGKRFEGSIASQRALVPGKKHFLDAATRNAEPRTLRDELHDYDSRERE